MENASKALIMAASVLLGIMIVSVAVALFNSFGGSGKQIMNQIEQSKIDEFNSQFLKFYGETKVWNEKTNKYEEKKAEMTIHDVVSLANLARKNNIQYEVTEQKNENEDVYDENSYYIQIDLDLKDGKKNGKKLETKNESDLIKLIQYNDITTTNTENVETVETKYFYISEVKISKKTKRVIYVKIEELQKK